MKTKKQAVKLVIVESPTKAKTLSKFLGQDYQVVASVGHIRDLPKSSLGVEVDKNFAPIYEIPAGKEKIVSKLKSFSSKAKEVYLATDLDREGEAIAWHLAKILDLDLEKVRRAVFHEITKSAIQDAFTHPRSLDFDLINAQQARRVLDRLVGYKLSPLLWKKIRYGLSAGRVQSVALRFIVEREKERDEFKSSQYWSIEARLQSKEKTFTAELISKEGKKYAATSTLKLFDGEYKVSNSTLTSLLATQKVIKDLNTKDFKVEAVEYRDVKKTPAPPFTTSSLQRAAANQLRLSSRKTMRLAQQLYERGLITYHRTDSLSLSSDFVEKSRNYAKKEYGAQYIPKSANFYQTKSKHAQEAHEAIRPTRVIVKPQGRLTPDQLRVYKLIFSRAVASQLVPAVYSRLSVEIKAGAYQLRAGGSSLKFDGWMKAFGNQKVAELDFPSLKKGDALELVKLDSQKHLTAAPPRYTEASLIKSLEKYGIGRPSTYATIVSTVQSRNYVYKEGSAFVPTDTGEVVSNLLSKHFSQVVDIEFTANMERDLDNVAEGKLDWVPMVREFYLPFQKNLSEKETTLKKEDITTLAKTTKKCPECGEALIVKLGKFGKFLSCTGFPKCKYGELLDDEKTNGMDESQVDQSQLGKCPECEGELKLKQGRFGSFVGCAGYPKCKFTKNYLEKIGMKCPECEEGEVVVKKTKKGRMFFGCSRYPDCKYTVWKDPRKG